MGRLDGKVAIITGAAAGMGAAEVRRFAQEGAKVLATDIAVEDVEKVANEVNVDFPGSVIAMKQDVSLEDDWKAAVKKAIDSFGKINILVNNAGLLATKPYEEVTHDYFQVAMNVNAWGPFVGIRTVAPYLKKEGGGSIVNIGSLASIIAAGGFTAYTASKGAVEAMTRAAAVELAPFNIRVNSVQPGGIKTKMLTDTLTTEEALAAASVGVPLKRFGEPEEIADLVLFLASDDSTYITGERHIIDGGYWLI